MQPVRLPREDSTSRDPKSGVLVRQVTSAPAIHHHPFFFVPAYDRAERFLFFVSHRGGRPQIMAEDRAAGELLCLTDRDDIAEWSVHPSPDGGRVYFTAGSAAWMVDTATGAEERLADFGAAEMREKGMVGAAMGTTALSASGDWWAVPVRTGARTRFHLIDTRKGTSEVFLERDTIGHPQFCPDDDDLILYAGPLTDRVWVTDRSGARNRRVHEREDPLQWVTHETWIPGRKAIMFVDWARGLRRIDLASGAVDWLSRFPAWHAITDATGRRVVCDTNFPDIGMHLLDLAGAPDAGADFLAWSHASSAGFHWAGPFPYNDGPVAVYAPQHTHAHPRFSPSGRHVVFTSDRDGHAQVYEITLEPETAAS